MSVFIAPLLFAQLHMPPTQQRNVIVKEVTSATTFTVKEGFTVRINCIKATNTGQMGLTSLMNLIMPGDPILLEYTSSPIVSTVYSRGHSNTLINIGAVQVTEGHATWDAYNCSTK